MVAIITNRPVHPQENRFGEKAHAGPRKRFKFTWAWNSGIPGFSNVIKKTSMYRRQEDIISVDSLICEVSMGKERKARQRPGQRPPVPTYLLPPGFYPHDYQYYPHQLTHPSVFTPCLITF